MKIVCGIRFTYVGYTVTCSNTNIVGFTADGGGKHKTRRVISRNNRRTNV